jgi:hypothetical protein
MNLKGILSEIDFATQQAFDNYAKNHQMRPTTQVTVAGKNMTAAQAQSKGTTSKADDRVANKVSTKAFAPKVTNKDVADAKDFFEDTAAGQDFARQFKKGFEADTFKDYLKDRLSSGGMRNPRKTQNAIKVWGKMLGVDVTPFISGDVIEDTDAIEAFTERAKVLHSIHTGKLKPEQPKAAEKKANVHKPISAGSVEAKKISHFTGLRDTAVADFINKHGLDADAVGKYVENGKLKDRTDFMTAIVGNPGNPIEKKMIKMFGDASKVAEPKKSETPKVQPRPADKNVVKTVAKVSSKFGLDAKKLGKEEYEKRMLSLVHDTLEDANFHGENRAIFASLLGNPKLAQRPDYKKAPEFGTTEYEEWTDKNTIYGKGFKSMTSEFDGIRDAAVGISSSTGWNGQMALDGILDKMRKDGSAELADKIQAAFDKSTNESKSNLKSLLPKLTEGKNWAKMMAGVKKGSQTGPWTIVQSLNKKLYYQRQVKTRDAIPANFEDIKKTRNMPGSIIAIEDNQGMTVYSEKI